MKNILGKLTKIQVELKAPKNQVNSFGKYKYRNCEDILEAVKPLLEKYKAVINITDELILIGDRYYIKATAIVYDTETGENISASSFAREEEQKKGMDSSQITGSASSYARKYALNGLLAIDDTKDSDTTNKHEKEDTKAPEKAEKTITPAQAKRMFAIAKGDLDLVKKIIKNYGHESTSTITTKEYDSIIKDIESVEGA